MGMCLFFKHLLGTSHCTGPRWWQKKRETTFCMAFMLLLECMKWLGKVFTGAGESSHPIKARTREKMVLRGPRERRNMVRFRAPSVYLSECGGRHHYWNVNWDKIGEWVVLSVQICVFLVSTKQKTSLKETSFENSYWLNKNFRVFTRHWALRQETGWEARGRISWEIN